MLKSSFLRKVFLILSITVFFGFGSLTLWIASSVRRSFREANLRILQEVHAQHRQEILGWLAEKRKKVEGLAKVFEFSDTVDPRILEAYKKIYTDFSEFLIIDRLGNIILTSRGIPKSTAPNLGDREYFQAALAGKVYTTGFFKGRYTGMATLAIASPILRAGKPEKVLAGFISLPRFVELFATKPSTEKSRLSLPSLSVTFINTMGQVISDQSYIDRYQKDPEIESDPSLVSNSPAVQHLLKNQPGASIYAYAGNRYYGVYAWIEPLKIGLIKEQDQNILESPLDRQLYSLLIVAGSVFILLMGSMVFVLWYLYRPLAQMVEVMDTIIEGKSKESVSFKKTHSQVDTLIETFTKVLQTVDQRESRLRDLASKDTLTGLYNQGTLKDLLKREYLRRKRIGRPVCFLMADIDHFKEINDNLGHLVGDRMLQEVSRVIESCVRPGDIVARYGGEEFAVLLDTDNINASNALAERIRNRVEAHSFMVDGNRLPVTISVGWTCLSSTEIEEVEQIIQVTDTALYRAKEAGRNCVRGNP